MQQIHRTETVQTTELMCNISYGCQMGWDENFRSCWSFGSFTHISLTEFAQNVVGVFSVAKSIQWVEVLQAKLLVDESSQEWAIRAFVVEDHLLT